jgi:hypothetical protein
VVNAPYNRRVIADDLVLRALRHEPAPWPQSARDDLASAVVDAGEAHGVVALVGVSPSVHEWPATVRALLRRRLHAEAIVEPRRREALTEIVEAFGAADVPVLLLKGAHLAYSHYPHAWLRPRADTDLLVRPDDRAGADGVLRRLGYRPHTHYDGALVTHQFQYERDTELVDLHWKIANPHAFADVFAFDELDAAAVPVDALGPHARGPSNSHALVLACVHRVAHHDNTDRLIWFYDIHRLIAAMSPAELRGAAALADAKRVGAVCRSSLLEAAERLATDVPSEWTRRDVNRGEPTADFLELHRTKIDLLRSDLRALDGWRPRLRLICEHAFPPAAYIRHTYGISSPLLLPLAYVYRFARGLGRWMSPS